MPDDPNNQSILSQLDDSEKGDIITDEELEEIGVAYGSKAKYEQSMRGIAERLSAAQARRGTYVPVGNGRTSPRIKAGTSTVPVGNLPKIKRVNIVGKAIHNAGDAAQLFSIFRDPRIEIFNIAYVSRTGKVLAHSAWTSGLPSNSTFVDGNTRDEGFQLIQKTMEHLGANHFWVSHNHPSGNPEPSVEDEKATEAYRSCFKEKFAGHIILDHKEYSLFENDFFNNRSFERRAFKEPVKRFITERQERAITISDPEDIARLFKNVFSKNADTTAYAVLDNKNRVVSWLYGGDSYADELKEYMRAAGGAKVITLTNNSFLYDKHCFRANQSGDKKYDVMLDVILVNRKTGDFERSHSRDEPPSGAAWQYNEPKSLNYIVKNHVNNPELELSPTLSGPANNIKVNAMPDEYKRFWKVIYQFDTDKKEKTSDIYSTSTYDGKPKNKLAKISDSILRYTEYFDRSDSTNAHKKLLLFQEIGFADAYREMLSWAKNGFIDLDHWSMPKQVKGPPLSGQVNNIKENTMSDINENPAVEQDTSVEKNLTDRELAFRNETWQRKVIADALKNNTCSCLPGADGYADTKPAVNLVIGTVYHGANLLFLKEHQKQNHFPTAEYATLSQIDRAKESNPSLFIIKGQKGVSVHTSVKNEETGEYDEKHIRLFNVSQLNKPQLFKKWAEDVRLEKFTNYSQYMQELHGDAWKPPEARQKGPGPEIVCKSTEPAEYLGQYLAAVSMGGKFKASPEQGKEFAQKMVDSLYAKTEICKSGERQGELVSDPFKLTKISREASRHCKEVIKEIMRPNITHEQKQEQKQEQSRGIGR
jgi:DNA repair protein RadC